MAAIEGNHNGCSYRDATKSCIRHKNWIPKDTIEPIKQKREAKVNSPDIRIQETSKQSSKDAAKEQVKGTRIIMQLTEKKQKERKGMTGTFSKQ